MGVSDIILSNNLVVSLLFLFYRHKLNYNLIVDYITTGFLDVFGEYKLIQWNVTEI